MKTRKLPRFEIDTDGMKALQAGREPWQLVKELISNVFDEKSATMCDVEIESISRLKCSIVVSDDAHGFSDHTDAWILMGHTDKRNNPEMRGRFNIGEKEIISVADEAIIETNGYSIEFPKGGGRLVKKIRRVPGTTIRCIMPWGIRQCDDIIANLKKLLPPDRIIYMINGEIIKYRKPEIITSATLDTVIQDKPGDPLRNTRRNTEIHIYHSESKTGWLYELGIPINKIDCPYIVDIRQKVPMPPNRDMVNTSYLKKMYAAVLNAVYIDITADNSSESWVRMALETGETNPQTIRDIVTKRYGDKVLIYSSNQQSNQRAIENGFTVIHPKTLSPSERANIIEHTGMKHTSQIFQQIGGMSPGDLKIYTDDELSDGMKVIRDFALTLAPQLINRNIQVKFYYSKYTRAMADWAADTLSFNTFHCGRNFFNELGESQIGVVLHEFAHIEGNWHDGDWQNSFNVLSGRAVILALQKPDLFKYETYVI